MSIWIDDGYAEALESASDDYYTGINAASKSVLLGTVVIRQYSSTSKSVKAIQNREKVRSRPTRIFIVAICPFGFSFQLRNLPAHLCDLSLQSFLRHEERTEQVPTQIEKVCNRLEWPHRQLCGPAFVAMVQSADFSNFNDPASL